MDLILWMLVPGVVATDTVNKMLAWVTIQALSGDVKGKLLSVPLNKCLLFDPPSHDIFKKLLEEEKNNAVD